MSLWCHTRQRKLAKPQTRSPNINTALRSHHLTEPSQQDEQRVQQQRGERVDKLQPRYVHGRDEQLFKFLSAPDTCSAEPNSKTAQAMTSVYEFMRKGCGLGDRTSIIMQLLEESADQSAIASVTSSPVVVFYSHGGHFTKLCLKARVVSFNVRISTD